MNLVGMYECKENGSAYELYISVNKKNKELLLATRENGNIHIVSAAKDDEDNSFNCGNMLARRILEIVKSCDRKAKSNGYGAPCLLGTSTIYDVKIKGNCSVQKHNGQLFSLDYESDIDIINFEYTDKKWNTGNKLKYVKETKARIIDSSEEVSARIRTVEEIMLLKEDCTFVKNKKYYILNNDATVEKLLSMLDDYKGLIAYDVETTGLRINMFGKINSEYKKDLEKYNNENPNDAAYVDSLVGVIFCVEKDVAYYIPVGHKRFSNAYENVDSVVRKKTIQNIRSRYTIGIDHNTDTDMARLFRELPDDKLTPDVILMERCRWILENKVSRKCTYNGGFEYKVGLMYDIDTMVTDDAYILYGLIKKPWEPYGVRRGSLKDRSMIELNWDQWTLHDFFPDYKEDKGDNIRKKHNIINFSLMDYEGTRIYGPADGDATLQITNMYTDELMKNHKNMEVLYRTEVSVMCAIGYMEFYGHRIDESKINTLRIRNLLEMVMLESELRDLINFRSDLERMAYEAVPLADEDDKKEDKGAIISRKLSDDDMMKLYTGIREAIDNDKENVINFGSSYQVTMAMHDILGIKQITAKRSASKLVQRQYNNFKNEDGSYMYPFVYKFSCWKKKDILNQKFYGKLPDFMYPGGFIFPHYLINQARTGRMSCNKPNQQQYPPEIKNIVSARKNCVMLDCDYSQIEYRTLAGMAGESNLIDMLKDPDNDYHRIKASIMYDVPYELVEASMRSAAKSFNFGIPYGMGPKSLALLLVGRQTTADIEYAIKMTEKYFEGQDNIREFFENVRGNAVLNGESKTLWSRVRKYNVYNDKGEKDFARIGMVRRESGNAVIQGTAADIFEIGIARVFNLIIRKYKLFGKVFISGLIHDEQLQEVDITSVNLKKYMSEVAKCMDVGRIPGGKGCEFPPIYTGMGVGTTWGTAKSDKSEWHVDQIKQLHVEVNDEDINKRDYETIEDVLNDMGARIKEFKKIKVYDYISNKQNRGKALKPAVGFILNDTFNGEKSKNVLWHDKYKSKHDAFIAENNVEENTKSKLDTLYDCIAKNNSIDGSKAGLGELNKACKEIGLSGSLVELYVNEMQEYISKQDIDIEHTLYNLSEFAAEHNVDVDAEEFRGTVIQRDNKFTGKIIIHDEDEYDDEYNDEEEENEEDDDIDDILGSGYKLIESGEVVAGVDIKHVVREFGFVITKDTFAIDALRYSSKLDELKDIIKGRTYNGKIEKGVELAILGQDGVMNRSGMYIHMGSNMRKRINDWSEISG